MNKYIEIKDVINLFKAIAILYPGIFKYKTHGLIIIKNGEEQKDANIQLELHDIDEYFREEFVRLENDKVNYKFTLSTYGLRALIKYIFRLYDLSTMYKKSIEDLISKAAENPATITRLVPKERREEKSDVIFIEKLQKQEELRQKNLHLSKQTKKESTKDIDKETTKDEDKKAKKVTKNVSVKREEKPKENITKKDPVKKTAQNKTPTKKTTVKKSTITKSKTK